MIGYLVKNTMTKNGAVKRGVCEVVDGKLNDIIECSIEEKKGKIMATPLNEEEFLEIGSFEVDSLETVSMNLFLLTETFFSYLEKAFLKFLEENKEDLQNREFFIPDVVFAAIEEDYATFLFLRQSLLGMELLIEKI